MAHSSQRNHLCYDSGSNNCSWSLWYKKISSCIRFHNSFDYRHAPLLRVLQAAIPSNIPKHSCRGSQLEMEAACVRVRFSFSQVQPCYCLNFQVLIEMDRKDKQCGRMEEIYQRLRTAYCQFTLLSKRDTSTSGCSSSHDSSENSVTDAESAKPGYNLTTSGYHSLKKPC